MTVKRREKSRKKTYSFQEIFVHLCLQKLIHKRKQTYWKTKFRRSL